MAPRLVTLGLALLLAACSRPRPSAEYERARVLWGEIVATQPAAPADDPRSDEVLRLLGLVPAGSADAADAKVLRDRIVGERRAAADERARREELAVRAGHLPSMPESAPVAERRPPAQEAPQGPPPVVTGMKVEEFRAAYGSCFAAGGPVEITFPGKSSKPGEMWLMKDDAACRTAHPALVGQVVLVADGAVAGVSPATALRRVEVRRDVQLAPLPDGSTGMVVDGKVVPLPEGTKLAPPQGTAP